MMVTITFCVTRSLKTATTNCFSLLCKSRFNGKKNAEHRTTAQQNKQKSSCGRVLMVVDVNKKKYSQYKFLIG